MSFGWSIGDVLAGANLTYTLITNLSDTKGACIEYQEAIQELTAFQNAFLMIEKLRVSDTIDSALLNGAFYSVSSAMGSIGDFLEKTKNYRKTLKAGPPGSMVSTSWLKAGWMLFKKEELVALKMQLSSKLTMLNLLLTTANVYGDSGTEKYNAKYIFQPIISELSTQSSKAIPVQRLRGESDSKDPPKGTPGISSVASNSAPMHQEHENDEYEAQTEKMLSHREENEDQQPVFEIESAKTIKFIDPTGREFDVKYDNCKSWNEMKAAMSSVFPFWVVNVHYDLFLPNGTKISSQDWEMVNMSENPVSMRLRTPVNAFPDTRQEYFSSQSFPEATIPEAITAAHEMPDIYLNSSSKPRHIFSRRIASLKEKVKWPKSNAKLSRAASCPTRPLGSNSQIYESNSHQIYELA